jgi:hypothetical protein
MLTSPRDVSQLDFQVFNSQRLHLVKGSGIGLCSRSMINVLATA